MIRMHGKRATIRKPKIPFIIGWHRRYAKPKMTYFAVEHSLHLYVDSKATPLAKTRASNIATKLLAKTKVSKDGLAPLFKWTGGKRREIKRFESYFPDFVKDNRIYAYVEPFVGAGAVFFYLNNINGQNVINDFDPLLINFYEQFATGNQAVIDALIAIGSITDHDELEATYYNLRDKDKNDGLAQLSDTEKAIRFFTVNQLAFSGMRRFNSDGEFNVPFGHYKRLNTDVIKSEPHRKLLLNASIQCGDFAKVMKENDKLNTFIFLDPPYTRTFTEYSAGNAFDAEEHKRLASTIKEMKQASVMMIINNSPITQDLYAGLITETTPSYALSYGVNIKNRLGTSAEHLVIRNYT